MMQLSHHMKHFYQSLLEQNKSEIYLHASVVLAENEKLELKKEYPFLQQSDIMGSKEVMLYNI